MLQSMNTAATGMVAQQYNLDIISNNLANVNTTAFKTQRAEFNDLTYQTMQLSGTSTSASTLQPTSVQVGLGVNFSSNATSFTQGPMESTGNALDVAIKGNGFFKVKLPDGNFAYTRDGNFQTDANGNMVTSDGYSLEPPINIPTGATAVNIAADGTVSGLLPGANDPTTLGNMKVSVVPNPAGMTRMGQNLYTANTASGTPTDVAPGDSGTGAGTLQATFLEGSNVQVVDEMVRMIMAQRAYEINSKAIQTSDQLLSMVDGLAR